MESVPSAIQAAIKQQLSDLRTKWKEELRIADVSKEDEVSGLLEKENNYLNDTRNSVKVMKVS